MKKPLGPDRRFPQADREAWISLVVYGLYFVWWYVCAYGLGSGDPEEYSAVFGFPSWFFYGCILGYPVLTLALWLVVRRCFRDLSLDAVDAMDALDAEDAEEEAQPSPADPEAAKPNGGTC